MNKINPFKFKTLVVFFVMMLFTSVSFAHTLTIKKYVYVEDSIDEENIHTVTGAGANYKADQKVTVNATPAKGYVFCGWKTDNKAWLEKNKKLLGFGGTVTAATCSFTMPDEDVVLSAYFVNSQEDYLDVDGWSAIVLKGEKLEDENCEAIYSFVDLYYGLYLPDEDGKIELLLDGGIISSFSPAKVSVKSLPKGITFNQVEAKISGDTSALKPGIYKITISATNSTEKKAKTTDIYLYVGEDNLFFEEGYFQVLPAGASNLDELVPKWKELNDYFESKANIENVKYSFAGLPSGITYNTKTKRLTGKATKCGVYIIKVKETQGKVNNEFYLSVMVKGIDWCLYWCPSDISDKLNATISDSDLGGGTITTALSGECVPGNKISVSAKADPDSVFIKWFIGTEAEVGDLGWYTRTVITDTATSASFSFVVPDDRAEYEYKSLQEEGGYKSDLYIFPVFVKKEADKKKLNINVVPTYTTKGDGTVDEHLFTIDTYTPAKVTVKGLPSGLKFDAKTFKFSGAATKPGVSTVTISASNTNAKKEATFKIIVPNFQSGLDLGLKYESDAYSVKVGVSDVSQFPQITNSNEVSSIAVSGLPSGLKWDSKSNSITGVATKAGNYTVTIKSTIMDGKKKITKVDTVTVIVSDMEVWSFGNFTGVATYKNKLDEANHCLGTVTASISKNGSLSGKMIFMINGKSYTIPFTSKAACSYDNENAFYIYDAEFNVPKGCLLNISKMHKIFVYATKMPDSTVPCMLIDNDLEEDDLEVMFNVAQDLWNTKGTPLNLPVIKQKFSVDKTLDDGANVTLTFDTKGKVLITMSTINPKTNKKISGSVTSPLLIYLIAPSVQGIHDYYATIYGFIPNLSSSLIVFDLLEFSTKENNEIDTSSLEIN